jgi:hypothetical protein
VQRCVLGAHIHVNVGVREWMWLNVSESACESVCGLDVCESTCESVCLGANIHVDVGVREWMWLNVCGSTCESVCVAECARIYQ